MNRTPNLGLPQFEPSDKYRLEDYNEAYMKIDEKVKELKDKEAQLDTKLAEAQSIIDTWTQFKNNGGEIGGDLISSTLKSWGDTMVDGNLWIGNFSREQNGYTKLTNGLIIQWGTAEGMIGDFKTVTLPIAFPNNTLICGATVSKNITAEYDNMHLQATWVSCNRWGDVNVQVIFGGDTYTQDIFQADWFAIGY